MAAGVYLVQGWSAALDPWFQLALCSFIGVDIYFAVLMLVKREIVLEGGLQIWNAFKRD